MPDPRRLYLLTSWLLLCYPVNERAETGRENILQRRNKNPVAIFHLAVHRDPGCIHGDLAAVSRLECSELRYLPWYGALAVARGSSCKWT
jgi:hypothetical protein